MLFRSHPSIHTNAENIVEGTKARDVLMISGVKMNIFDIGEDYL